MPRPRYPSDEKRRKSRPAVRVHHSIRNHPRFAGIAAENDLFAPLVRLWLIASERHAGKTGDRITLTRGDVLWVCGRRDARTARPLLHRLCRACAYDAQEHDGLVTILIRNFAKKQGHTPHSASGVADTTAPSESESDSEKNTEYSSDSSSPQNTPSRTPDKAKGGNTLTRLWEKLYEDRKGLSYRCTKTEAIQLAQVSRAMGGADRLSGLILGFLELGNDPFVERSGYSVSAFTQRWRGLVGKHRGEMSQEEFDAFKSRWRADRQGQGAEPPP